MTDYLFYTYFESGREYFVYKDLRFERSQKKKTFHFWRVSCDLPTWISGR